MKEFPEHVDTIRHLKVADELFRKMFDEYHTVDDAVYRIEEEIDGASDQQFDELRLRRAQLKDQLYRAIRAAKAA